MMKYTTEKSEYALSRMNAPYNKSVAEVVQLAGVPEATLFVWRKRHANTWLAMEKNPKQWSSVDKFTVVLEATPLNEAEFAATAVAR